MASFDATLLDDGCCGVVRLTGDLDLATVERLVTVADDVRGRGIQHVVVDCRQLEFLDSSGLKGLLQLRETFRGKVALWGPKRAVRRLLEVTGLDETFTVAPTYDGCRRAVHRE